MKKQITIKNIRYAIVLLLCSALFSNAAQAQLKVLNNNYLRMGNGNENSINNLGNVQQPFYYNGALNVWRKLTYSTYPLDYSIGIGGDKTNSWNINGTITQNPVLTGQAIDYSGYIATSSNTGYGVVKSTGNVNVGGKALRIEQTYTLPQASGYIGIKVKVTNIDATLAENVRVWVGTRDDWVGDSDRPNKLRGNIINGVFVPNTTTAEQALAIKISTATEAVLVYTNSNRGQTSVSTCCSFSNATNTNPALSTTNITHDGSYAFFVRMNDLAPNQSDEFTWYYAAGSLADIEDIINEVAQASGSVQNITCAGATYNATATANGTGYWLAVPQGSVVPTAAQIKAGTNYGSVTVAASGSGTMVANTQRSFNISGLNLGSNYTVYFVHEDAVPQFSAIINSNFTTNAPVAAVTASGPVTFCTGSSVVLTAASGTGFAYQWKQNGNNIAGATGQSYTAATSGNYSVFVSIPGCASTATSTATTVTVNPKPQPTIINSGTAQLCAGNTVTLTASGSTLGNALSLDGSDDYVDIVPTSNVNNLGASGFTLEAWIKPTALDNQAKSIIRKTGDYNMFVYQGKISVEVWPVSGINNTWKQMIATTAGVPLNTWSHVAVTWDNSVLRLYVNGTEVSGNLVNGSINDVNENLLIGRSQIYGNPFSGEIDEVRIWNTSRSGTQINDNRFTFINPATTGLVAYYKFDEASGTATADATGLGSAGTLMNGTTRVVPSTVPISYSGYVWSPGGQTTPSITVSASGNYTVTATNAQGCSAISAATSITASPAPTFTSTLVQQSCVGSADGQVTVTAVSGTSPYQYSKDGGATYQTSNVFNELSAGSYSLRVKDANGCQSAITAKSIGINLVTNGDFEAGNSGFTSGYGLRTSGIINEGQYEVSATPVHPCFTGPDHSATGTNAFYANGSGTPNTTVWTQTINNIQPNTVYYFSSWVNIQCDVPAAILQFSINGTTIGAPFSPSTPLFSWQQFYTTWNSGSNTSATIRIVNQSTSLGGNDFGIDDIFFTTVAPLQITSVTKTSASCIANADASVTVTAQGGTAPYYFSMNNGISYVTGTSPYTFTGMAPGTYTLKTKDNCGIESNAQVVTVTHMDTIRPLAVAQNLTIELDANGSASISTSQINNGSNDACGIASMSVSPNIFTCDDVDATTSAQSTKALLFDGADDYLITNNTITHGSNFTYEAWVNINSSDDWDGIFTTLSPGNENLVQFVMNSAGRIRFEIIGAYGVNTRKIYDGSTDIRGAWHHIAATYDGISLKLFVNGVQEVISAIYDDDVVGTLSINKRFLMGSERSYGPRLNGKIDEIRMWNVTKTASQIYSEMNQTLTGTETGLIGYWPIEEGSGLVTADIVSGNTFNMANMNGTSWVQGNVSVLPQKGKYVTLTVTDSSNNTSTARAIVTVKDNIAPTALAQNITVQLNASGSASITASQINNGSTDNCSIDSITVSPDTFNCSNVGNNTVTLRVKDVNGNVSTRTATVTVEDNIAPTVLTQNITVELNASGSASITASQINNGSADNCSVDSITVSPNTFDCSNVGSNTVTLRVEDVNGNVSTQTATVTVRDNISPVAIAQNITAQLSNAGTVTVTPSQVNNNSTDNCGISSLKFQVPSANLFTNGSFTSGDAGWSKPFVHPTAGWMASGGSPGGMFVLNDVGSVSTDPTLTQTVNGLIAGTTYTISGFYRNHYACCGASNGIHALAIDVNGVEIITYPTLGQSWTPFSVNFTAQQTSAAIAFRAEINGTDIDMAVDELSLTATSASASSLSFTCSNVGSNQVTLLVTDVNGNSSTAMATVTVQDTIRPVAIAQNITIELDANGTASTTAAAVNNGSSDACGIRSVALSKTSFNCTNVGANTVTLTVTDNNNNVSTTTATVTVADNIAPTVLTQNITVELNASGSASITASQINNGSTDNCSIDSITVSPNTFNCSNVGNNTVILRVKDVNGNVSTRTATVTVVDNIAPTVLTQNITVELNASESASITASQINNGSTDNCSIDSITVSPNTFNCSNVGNNTVTLRVKDVNGNVSTRTATVTVADNVAPVAICRNVSLTIANGTASITASQVDNGSYDACGIKSVTLSKTTFSCADIGTNTVTMTVTDNNGNSSTCQATVTVSGVVPTCSIVSAPNNSGTVIGSTTTYAAVNQMFLGYGAQSMNITCTASGAGPFTYSWSGTGLSNTAISNPIFTPTVAGNYTLTCTVTNSYGCQSTCTITICVIDARGEGGSAKNPKVTICHIPPGNPNNPQTLSVGLSAVSAHIGQHGGDKLGSCNAVCGFGKTETIVGDLYSEETVNGEVNLIVYPNPSSSKFNFKLESESDELASLKVYDMAGRLVVEMNDLPAHQVIVLDNIQGAGIFMAHVTQGNFSKVVKITKVN